MLTGVITSFNHFDCWYTRRPFPGLVGCSVHIKPSPLWIDLVRTLSYWIQGFSVRVLACSKEFRWILCLQKSFGSPTYKRRVNFHRLMNFRWSFFHLVFQRTLLHLVFLRNRLRLSPSRGAGPGSRSSFKGSSMAKYSRVLLRSLLGRAVFAHRLSILPLWICL